MASEQKYISTKSSLSMGINENGVGRKHIEFVKKSQFQGYSPTRN